MPIKSNLAVALGPEVRLANDANCFALSEAVDGIARDARNVFGVIPGTGVGDGIVIDGEFLEGCNSIPGEWGHDLLTWPQDGDAGSRLPLRKNGMRRELFFVRPRNHRRLYSEPWISNASSAK